MTIAARLPLFGVLVLAAGLSFPRFSMADDAPVDTLAVSSGNGRVDEPASVHADLVADRVVARLKEGKVEVGFSVGVRTILQGRKSMRIDATISPIDTTLVTDFRDRADVTVSAVVMAFPFKDTNREFLKNLGFIGLVNLVEFSPDNARVFNKSIEGGLGLAYRLSPQFSLGLTFERVFSRGIRSYLSEGRKITVEGEPVTTINVDDDRFYHDDNLSALSIKMIYSL